MLSGRAPVGWPARSKDMAYEPRRRGTMHALLMTSRKIQQGLAAAIVLLGVMIPAAASAQEPLAAELEEVRQAAAQFDTVEAAEAAGYQLGYAKAGNDERIITGCIAHPTDGAMGYHYFNDALVNDVSVDSLKPEVLVYAPKPNGDLELVAVEWVVPSELVDFVPTVLGHDMHILVPAVGLYLTHAWVFKDNPSGVLSDWNPDVSCPVVMTPPSTGDAGLAAPTSASTGALLAVGLAAGLAIVARGVASLIRSRPR